MVKQVSVILQHKTSMKYKDQACPTMTVPIVQTYYGKALYMTFSLYQKLDLGDLKPTTITPCLADGSMKVPKGIIEDVLIEVLIILDTKGGEVQSPTPITLGRPFFVTSIVVINCRNGHMQLTFGSMTLESNIFKLMKHINLSQKSSLVLNVV